MAIAAPAPGIKPSIERGIAPDLDPVPATLDQAVARLIAEIGRDGFPAALVQLLALTCAFESPILTRHHGSARPQVIYHELDDIQAAISVTFYASGPYLLDPFYLACQENRAPRAYGLMELAPETFFRSEYYRVFYRKIRISDEMGLLIPEGDNRWIVLSLARKSGHPKFSKTDIARVNSIFHLLSAAVLKHWGAQPEDPAPSPASSGDKLASFGAEILSPREAQIVRLILQGHSTPTAAAYLGIAEGTVKVHRRHAYAKLGISSQVELFALVTDFLNSDPM